MSPRPERPELYEVQVFCRACAATIAWTGDVTLAEVIARHEHTSSRAESLGSLAHLSRAVENALEAAWKAGECAGALWGDCGDPECTTEQDARKTADALRALLGLPREGK